MADPKPTRTRGLKDKIDPRVAEEMGLNPDGSTKTEAAAAGDGRTEPLSPEAQAEISKEAAEGDVEGNRGQSDPADPPEVKDAAELSAESAGAATGKDGAQMVEDGRLPDPRPGAERFVAGTNDQDGNGSKGGSVTQAAANERAGMSRRERADARAAAREPGDVEIEVPEAEPETKAGDVKVGQIVNYHTARNRAGMRGDAIFPAIVTRIGEKGLPCLTVFDYRREIYVDDVSGSSKAGERYSIPK